jgi:NADPH2:quinone reductase
MVVFGNASRENRKVDTGALLQGSKAVIGFWLVHVLARRDLAVPLIGELLGALATGALQVTIGGVYPLSEAARAHEALESRASAGKLLLDPSL